MFSAENGGHMREGGRKVTCVLQIEDRLMREEGITGNHTLRLIPRPSFPVSVTAWARGIHRTLFRSHVTVPDLISSHDTNNPCGPVFI